jgi:hypothetical protein
MPTITIVVSRRYPVNTTPNGIKCRCLPLFCALPALNVMSDGRSGVPSTTVVGTDDEPYYAWTWKPMLPPFKCAMHVHNILRHSMCGIRRVVRKEVRCGNQIPSALTAFHIYTAWLGLCGRSKTLLRSRRLLDSRFIGPKTYHQLETDLTTASLPS